MLGGAAQRLERAPARSVLQDARGRQISALRVLGVDGGELGYADARFERGIDVLPRCIPIRMMDEGSVAVKEPKNLRPVPISLGRHHQSVQLGGGQPGLDFEVGFTTGPQKLLPVLPATMCAPAEHFAVLQARRRGLDKARAISAQCRLPRHVYVVGLEKILACGTCMRGIRGILVGEGGQMGHRAKAELGFFFT